MLRLRPSELTLTADDIEDTLRRIARTQAARASANITTSQRTSVGGPILRRGPQRAARDAITTLGNIPILRPQSQHVVPTRLDEDIERPPEETHASPQTEHPTGPGTSSPDERKKISTPSTMARILHLPFRLGQSRRGSATPTSSDEKAAEPGPSPTTPHVDRTEADLDESSESDKRHNRPSSGLGNTTGSPAELRGGGPRRRRPSPSDESKSDPSPDPPPPLPSSPAQTPAPILYLRGRFADVARDPPGSEYVFDEFWYVPQSEPRPNRQRDTVMRSLSSGNPPRNPLRAIRPRERNSEASNASAPYSFYELPPESRQASGNYTTTVPSQNQIGSYGAPSQRANSGSLYEMLIRQLPGYGTPVALPPSLINTNVPQHFIHPQAGNVMSQAEQMPAQPTGPPIPPFNPDMGTPAGVSPLPALPYNRGPPPTPIPPTGTWMDAATEAVRNLPSPLETFAEHYPQLRGPPGRPTQVQQYQPGPLPGHFDGTNTGRGGYVRNYNQASRAHMSQYGRRSNQRSSENAPGRPQNAASLARQSQVQMHREAYERLHNARQAMQSQVPVPRDLSNSINTNTPPAPRYQILQRPQQQQPTNPAPALTTSPSPPPSTVLPSIEHLPPRDDPLYLHPPTYPHRRLPPPPNPPSRPRMHRRVPHQQRDQENSGAAEEQMLMQEVDAARARYTEDVHGDTMDETPPPTGRIERRMLE